MLRPKPAAVRQPEVFPRPLPCSCCQPALLSSHQARPGRLQRQETLAEEVVAAPKPYESLTVRSNEPRKLCEKVLYPTLAAPAGCGVVETRKEVGWRTGWMTPTPPWTCKIQRVAKVRPSVTREVVV